jgi:hypothetical protein
VPPLSEQDLTNGMAAAMLLSMAAGVVLIAAWFVAVPAALQAVAALVWLGGIVAIGILTHREARSNGRGFWASLGTAFRRFLRALLHLFP